MRTSRSSVRGGRIGLDRLLIDPLEVPFFEFAAAAGAADLVLDRAASSVARRIPVDECRRARGALEDIAPSGVLDCRTPTASLLDLIEPGNDGLDGLSQALEGRMQRGGRARRRVIPSDVNCCWGEIAQDGIAPRPDGRDSGHAAPAERVKHYVSDPGVVVQYGDDGVRRYFGVVAMG